MTKTKLEYATILSELRKDGSDPKQLAQDMSLRKLLYEIEVLETAALPTVQEPAPDPPAPKEKKGLPKSFWSWVTHDSSDEDTE
jgi:site-specific recombinase XerC